MTAATQRTSIGSQFRQGAPRQLHGFVADSPLEEAGFELAVPVRGFRLRCTAARFLRPDGGRFSRRPFVAGDPQCRRQKFVRIATFLDPGLFQ